MIGVKSEALCRSRSQGGPEAAIKPEKEQEDEQCSLDDLFDGVNFVVQSPELDESFSLYLMSQPSGLEVPKFSSRLERLLWLQTQRDTGVYVTCDDCEKLRHLPAVKDPLDLPKKWFCHMNPDTFWNSCSTKEQPFTSVELTQMIDNVYNAGSIVWAWDQRGRPWMPAIVCDDPDVEQFYWIKDETQTDTPSMYHVVYFEQSQSPRKGWCKVNQLLPFKENPHKPIEKRFRSYSSALEQARKTALKALKMPLLQRLKQYSYVSRTKHLYS